MKISPLPENEKDRLQAIRSYHILDTEAELDFDGIVELAAQLCDTPISLITLIDERRQWFKAKTGLDIKETHRNLSFCAHAIHMNDIMVVGDASQDERFLDNPLVTGDPYIRFYAGMPLITSEGYKLGTLAVLDRKPKDLNEQQLKHLRILGRQVVNLLERRTTISQLKEINKEIASLVEEKTAEIKEVFERVSDAFVAVDKNWFITYINEKAAAITNRRTKDVIGKSFWNEFPEAFGAEFSKMAEVAMVTQHYHYWEAYVPIFSRWFETHIYPSRTGISIHFHDISERKMAELAIRSSEEQKRLIVNSALDAIICIDVSGVITVWNPQAEKLFDWNEKEMVGKHLIDTIIPEQYRNEHEKGLNHYLTTGEGPVLNRIIEITALNREGKEFPIELTITPIKQDGTEFFCAFIRDITERKKMEVGLRESEMHLRGILDSTNDGILAIDNNGKVINSNNRFAELWHIPQEVIEQKNDKALLAFVLNQLVDPEGFLSKVQGLYSSDIADFDLLLFKDGRVFERYSTPFILNKNIVGRVWSFRDITKRKQAEEDLRLSEANYRQLIEGTPQPMWVYDLENLDVLEVNEAAILKYGYSRVEFLKMNLIDLRPRKEVDKLIGFFKSGQITAIGLTQSGPWKHRLKSGELIDVEVTSHEINWKGRKARYALAWDVSKRLQTEESLRKAKEQYHSIFENTTEGIYQSTVEGKFLAANPSMAKIFGYSSPEELIADVTDIGTQLYTDPQERLHLRSLLEKEGKLFGFEHRVRKKNKEIIWVRDNIRVVYDHEGRIEYFEGTLEDISERKEAEEKLKTQFEELQKTNSELDRFVYSVSHDLRAPLASILGLINIAEMEGPAPSFKNYLTLIRNSINRLDGFIKDILDYSRNSRMGVRIEKIDFNELITETKNNLNLISGAERLRITAEINDTVTFYSDRTRIGILLSNLFSNSIKYQDFRKASSFLEVHAVTSSEKAMITVKDNGIGIGEKHVHKIFDMFYRASENSKGSGLGLYITKETIAKLGGTINVQSEFGVFTSFEISIPNSNPSS